MVCVNNIWANFEEKAAAAVLNALSIQQARTLLEAPNEPNEHMVL